MSEGPRLPLLSLAALLAAAGAFGLLLGLRAVPPGETEIINAVAADYVAETGGVATECLARPVPVDGVRLVVICGEDWLRAVGPFGEPVDIDPDLLEEAPQT